MVGPGHYRARAEIEQRHRTVQVVVAAAINQQPRSDRAGAVVGTDDEAIAIVTGQGPDLH